MTSPLTRVAAALAGLVAVPLAILPAPAAADTIPPNCTDFTVHAYDSDYSVTLSDSNGTWYTLYSGATSPAREWRKIRVPSGYDTELNSAGHSAPTSVILHNAEWYTISRWNCDTESGNYWWTKTKVNGWFD